MTIILSKDVKVGLCAFLRVILTDSMGVAQEDYLLLVGEMRHFLIPSHLQLIILCGYACACKVQSAIEETTPTPPPDPPINYNATYIVYDGCYVWLFIQ